MEILGVRGKALQWPFKGHKTLLKMYFMTSQVRWTICVLTEDPFDVETDKTCDDDDDYASVNNDDRSCQQVIAYQQVATSIHKFDVPKVDLNASSFEKLVILDCAVFEAPQ